MKEFPYRVVIEYSEEDEAYLARVPAFEGLAAHGETPYEAARQAQRAAEGIVDTLREEHKPVPEPDSTADYSGQLRLRLPRPLHARLARIAAVDGVSLNSLIVSLVSEGLSHHRA